MYINLNGLVYSLADSLLQQVIHTQVPDNPAQFDEKLTTVLSKFCEIHTILSEMPDSWVEIQGDEPYVKRSLFDIS